MAQYADILSVEVPAEANAGEIVDVRVEIKNLYTAVISVKVIGIIFVKGIAWAYVTFPTTYVNLDPDHKYQFWGYFTMPNNNVVVQAVSYWYGADGQWHSDDVMVKEIKLAAPPTDLGELQDIRYWNALTSTWQSSVPSFPYNNYAKLRCTAVNTSGKDYYFYMTWYGFNIYGQRLYQHVTQVTKLASGKSMTDSIEIFCNLPGTYSATCQLWASSVSGPPWQLVDWIGTLDIGVPIAYVSGVPEIEASIDTWHLWDWETNDWVRPSPTSVPLNEKIGIQGVAKNEGDTTLRMRIDVQIRSPSGALQMVLGDDRYIPPGLWPYDYPKWGLFWYATEAGDWEADLILRAGPSLEVVDRRDYIDVAHVAEYAPPVSEFSEFAISSFNKV